MKKLYQVLFKVNEFYLERNIILKVLLLPVYLLIFLLMGIVGWIIYIFGVIKYGWKEYNKRLYNDILSFVIADQTMKRG